MTITLHWWLIPLVVPVFLIGVGVVLANRQGGQTSSWDFVTPLIAMTFGLSGIIAAIVFEIGFFIGRWTR